MFAYHPGDEVAVQVAATGKGNGKPTVWKMGTVVFVGKKFVVVDLGKYRNTVDHSAIRAV